MIATISVYTFLLGDCIMEGVCDECIKPYTACNTILHPKVKPIVSAAGGVIYPLQHWSPGEKLRVYFRDCKFPTWRMESDPRKELITSDKILYMANVWRRCGGDAIPEFVKTENEQESDVRVLLSGNISWTLKTFHLSFSSFPFSAIELKLLGMTKVKVYTDWL